MNQEKTTKLISDFIFTKRMCQMLILKQLRLPPKNDSVSRTDTQIISCLYHCAKITSLTLHREINLLQTFLLDLYMFICKFYSIILISGYTRIIPNGGPLVNCIPCSCNNRSTMCDSQTGVCKNCRPGTKGNYCEKCIENVLEPACDRCVPGYWGLYTQKNGCKRKAIFLSIYLLHEKL